MEKSFYWESLEFGNVGHEGDDGFWSLLMLNSSKVDLKPETTLLGQCCCVQGGDVLVFGAGSGMCLGWNSGL